MRTVAAVAGALVISAALAQTESPQARAPRGIADGGTSRVRKPGPVLLGTDPPGRLRAAEPSDAGVAQIVDAGPSPLQLEVQQLRARVDALERERAQAQQQSQQLDEITRQLQELRAQMADAESRRQTAEQQQTARRQAMQSGVSALQQAQSLLAGGNSSIDDQLAQAEASFPPQAQRDIQYARDALRNRDLSLARTWLNSAIADAQQGK